MRPPRTRHQAPRQNKRMSWQWPIRPSRTSKLVCKSTHTHGQPPVVWFNAKSLIALQYHPPGLPTIVQDIRCSPMSNLTHEYRHAYLRIVVADMLLLCWLTQGGGTASSDSRGFG